MVMSTYQAGRVSVAVIVYYVPPAAGGQSHPRGTHDPLVHDHVDTVMGMPEQWACLYCACRMSTLSP
jgi:hypothetical protein